MPDNNKAQRPGHIIIVNGTSGSGKSTTCEHFVQRSEDFWITQGIDQFMGSSFPKRYGHHGDRCREGYWSELVDTDDPEGPLRWQFSDQGLQAFSAFHEWIAVTSRLGCHIILDHLMMLDPPLLQDCIWRLSGLPVLFVNLKPPYEVLVERIANREVGNRFSNSRYSSEQIQQSRKRLDRLRPWFYQAVYANDCYDLEIDSAHCLPDEVCELIENRLAEGPGTAFNTLRQQYPKHF